MSWRFSKKKTHGQEGTKFKRGSKTSEKINIRREIKKLNKKYGEDTVTIAMRTLSKDEKFIKLPIENQLEILKADLKIRARAIDMLIYIDVYIILWRRLSGRRT